MCYYFYYLIYGKKCPRVINHVNEPEAQVSDFKYVLSSNHVWPIYLLFVEAEFIVSEKIEPFQITMIPHVFQNQKLGCHLDYLSFFVNWR